MGLNMDIQEVLFSGSLIAYLLGITEVDPIRFNLNFERFMNEERVSLADIDSDWF